jgi:hypothetical protein
VLVSAGADINATNHQERGVVVAQFFDQLPFGVRMSCHVAPSRMTLRAAEAVIPAQPAMVLQWLRTGCQRECDPRDGLRHRGSPTISLDTMV